MTRISHHIVMFAFVAACASALALAGCGSVGAPHPGSNAPAASRARAPFLLGTRYGFRGGLDIPTHVLTYDVYTRAGEVDPAIAAPYLDYAELPYKDVNAFDAAGIKTILYTDPNRTYVGQPMYTQDESTFAHDCSGNRITVGHRRYVTYQMDPRSPDLEPLWNNWVYGLLNAGYNYSYIFEDAANNIHNDSAVPCGYDEASWTAASNANDTLLGQPILYNGLGTLADGVNNPPPSLLLNPTTWGGHLEGCYGNITVVNPLPKTAVWHNFETSELTMATLQKPFFCRGLSSPPAETAYAQRIYQYASFLLTYDPGTSAISEKFSTASNLSVFPEETLVALQPLIPLPASVNKLKTSHWTYGRQYAACYLAGQLIGSCAAVVNADNPTVSHPFPWPGVYTHTLVLNGAGITDGGTASAAGPPPPDMVPGTSAVIAIQ